MIEYKVLTKEEFYPHFNLHRPLIFSDTHSINLNSCYDNNEKKIMNILDKQCSSAYQLYLTAWDKNNFIGWCFGYQKSGIEFYMCNSAVLPEYRRRHIYTELLNSTIKISLEAGFQEITSNHLADNNFVIIPKLKKGFVIKGFEISPRFGLMVNLVYYANQNILSIHNQRVGSRK